MNLVEYYEARIAGYTGVREHPEWIALQTKVARERTCTYWVTDHWCGSEASLYGAGWRCEDHKPTGSWMQNIGVNVTKCDDEILAEDG